MFKIKTLQNYRLDHLRKGRNEIASAFEVVLDGGVVISVPAL